MDAHPGRSRVVTGNPWRAGCGESRTSGSEGGPGKRAGRNSGTAPWSDPYTNQARPAPFAVLDAYPGRVNDVAYGPADRNLSAAGPDKTIRTWTTNPDDVAATICSNPAGVITHEGWGRYLPGRPYTTPCP